MIMLHKSGQMIQNCTNLLPNIIQTNTMNIELTPMTEFQLRVDETQELTCSVSINYYLSILCFGATCSLI